MTDVLDSATPANARKAKPNKQVVRPLPLTAVVMAVLACVIGLAASTALMFFGWVASGSTQSAVATIPAGVNGWLLAHRAGVRIDAITYTLAPLGATALLAWLIFTICRWAARTAPRSTAADIGQATAAFAVTYVVIAEIAAVLVSLDKIGAALPQVLAGTAGLSLVFGGLGFASGGQLWSSLSLPVGVDRRTWLMAKRIVLGVSAAGLILTLGSALLHAGEVAASFARLEVGTAEGVVVVVMMLLLLPNAVLWSASVLFGPGFSVGTDTFVTTSAVALGPVPGFPMLAALPNEGTAPWWVSLLLTIPALVAVVVVGRDLWRRPVLVWRESAIRGVLAGGGAGVVLGLLMVLSGGSMGTDRLAHVGPIGWLPVALAVASLAAAGLVSALAMTMLQRRWAPQLQADRRL